MSGRLRRITALLLKEARQTYRNKTALSVALAGPVILLILFIYSLSLDTDRVPLGIVVDQSTPDARDLAGAFYNTNYFNSVFMPDRKVAGRALARGEISGVVLLAGDFARAAGGEGDAPVQVLIDGVDARTGRQVSSYADGAVATWLAQRTLVGRVGASDAVRNVPRIWFNSEIQSRNFLAPGMIALLMAVVGPLLSALMIAREWEHGTMESILATPMTPRELLFTKLGFYMAFGLAAMALMLTVSVYVIDVPFRGSLRPLALATPLFIACTLGMGLLISLTSRNQLAAVKLTLTTGFLPAYMMSGFLFDLRNAPDAIQWLSFIVPARYFVSILQTVLLVGDEWRIVVPDLIGLALLALALIGTASLLIRRRLA